MKATNIRKGQILRVKGAIYRVLNMEHVTPGKGRAHVQTKLRNIVEGTQTEVRFRSDDVVERVALETKEMQFLYEDQAGLHFMDVASYEQVTLAEEQIGEAKAYLLPDTVIQVQWFEGRPLGVELPPIVELKVVDTPPSVKDATASAQRKPATLETGLVIQVPAFIESGETIRVNTLDGSYSERVK
jgi:elongation factor P